MMLLQATAQGIPFPCYAFDYVMAINVLEYVFTPETMLAEVHRVLAVDGVFCGDSRNRFDPLFPKPHVGLRWAGFLPRRWMASYVHWRTGVNYDHTYLLSHGDLRNALSATFGREWRIALPDVSAYGIPTVAKRIVEWADGTSALQSILLRLSPTHLVLARRTA